MRLLPSAEVAGEEEPAADGRGHGVPGGQAPPAALIMSRADDDTVMEAVDSEVSVTCTDMGLVQKAFQALLCTKRHPIDQPMMHEVARVLLSLMQLLPSRSHPHACSLFISDIG
ncbi:LRR receptor-like serine/threonine-protein kinase SIK1 isoform X1 [Aegilops tauschii subsp. strangulata]|nr:LRR receptor-like serine/threonine-protein kinase SIK1 isoform X2 [Aegilops tauschii subsp. strangulata]XP_020175727.1 LRR receptor-like serine/threonine-protein kinase SIK1 isoform X2 [Aegilops tauschii subsp. strangulata]XP_044374642.1 LRR receptor-like serine/threonine-protein kinase SIK1 isoform X1 [Triticum aestivum]